LVIYLLFILISQLAAIINFDVDTSFTCSVINNDNDNDTVKVSLSDKTAMVIKYLNFWEM
jgi:hypothetical protein